VPPNFVYFLQNGPLSVPFGLLHAQHLTMKILKYECDSCYGTGLYSGMCEKEGEAVICFGCKGSGRAEFHYHEFTRRKPSRGIKTVYQSTGNYVATGVRGTVKSISYKQFCAGKMPK
jgi:hypothetical protein